MSMVTAWKSDVYHLLPKEGVLGIEVRTERLALRYLLLNSVYFTV